MKYSFLGLFLCCCLCAIAQSLPDSMVRKVDSLFSKWNDPNSPGCAVGIIRNDSLIFAKGYGMANLEYSIPISPQTPFHMASISKQFTGYAIVLLARQGKLKLEDDIRKYLPWFPDLGEKITIQHLLIHSSGIRDQWQLLAISGTRLDDVITQEHIVKILSKQQALNFKPNEKSSYSNSGYTMLAEIVKAVSGQTLRKFTDSAIFKPLGMNSTHFHDDATEVEKNRSYSYNRLDSVRFSNSILSYSNAGATSLFTNVQDLSKWVMHFYNHRPEEQQAIDMLTKKSKLNDGKELPYANGIVVDTYHGWKQWAHAGGDAGYRTYLTVFPDNKMGFLVFSNLGDVNVGSLTYGVVDLFIKDTAKGLSQIKDKNIHSSLSILKDTLSMRKYLGDYAGQEDLQMNISISSAPDSVLKKYTGRYYCPELDCTYGIVLKDGGLVLTNNKYNDAKIRLIGNDDLMNDHWWMNHLVILRNAAKEIIGFEVNSGRIMHLRFNKVL